MDDRALADFLFPDITDTPAHLETRYPPRALPEGARVCRMAPSPTGFMHLGNLFGAITDERLAHQSGGVFYLRIEDTDQKREVPGGVDTILDVFTRYGLPFDEGVTREGDRGAYGPYRQRRRAEIYHICAKHLVANGQAYPCFLTEEELAALREAQAAEKLNFGCYGRFARYRDAAMDEIKRRVREGQSYVVRYRSPGNPANRERVTDLIRGALDFPENDQDVVLLKADGIPTYHFAHVVDDHFMRTTLVVRGEEWLATLPIHLQLFKALGFKPPQYLHTAHLMKQDGEGRRKLSKRKDPELALSWYDEQGYPVAAVREYLLSLLNSNFEDWRAANPAAPLENFPFSAGKMSVSGALFGMDKLNDVSKGVLARLDAPALYAELSAWARRHSPAFAALLEQDSAYAQRFIAIGRGGKNPRKDFATFAEAQVYYGFYYDETFTPGYTLPPAVPPQAALGMLQGFADTYSPDDDSAAWFDKVKAVARGSGYADDMKAYKQNPQNWPGSVADVSMVLRLAIAGRPQSPDLCEVMRVMGSARAHRRLQRMMDALQAQ